MIRYLLDTNICIYLIKHHPPEARKRFTHHSPRTVAISIITVFELEYGAQKSQYRKRTWDALGKFLAPLNVIDLDRSSVRESAAIRVQLEKEGLPIGPYDLLIAGSAKSQGLTLVTNNTREFERINGLHLENWVQ
ncbi:MAG: type II toxin-antitoxin system VapC family toxin [Deltaproteobacteria bacterium]|nr:type II toxin-antitoxin system VapC family toxin [Deltaproteobacteria bacterium]